METLIRALGACVSHMKCGGLRLAERLGRKLDNGMPVGTQQPHLRPRLGFSRSKTSAANHLAGHKDE